MQWLLEQLQRATLPVPLPGTVRSVLEANVGALDVGQEREDGVPLHRDVPNEKKILFFNLCNVVAYILIM